MKITPFLKKSLLLVLIGVLATMMIAPAFATEHLLQSQSVLNNVYAGLPVQDRGWGFHITGNGEYLSRLVLYAYNTSASTSTIVRGYLYNASVTLPDSPYNPIDVTAQVTVNPTAEYTEYEFDFESDVILVSGEGYFIAVCQNNTGTGTSRWHKGASTGLGYLDTKDGWGDEWTAYGYSLIHDVYTDDEEGGGAPYTPPGTADLTSWDNLINSFTEFMVPLIVMLLPAFLLCFITRRVDKWLLLIGLAIGAGLGYYFGMVPLWLVFLVTIGLIGMAYQSVRSGGDNT